MDNCEGYADVLVGLQYGDEGKAKVVDALAGEYDIIARFNGGSNAGHTVVTKHSSIKLRQIPSGILHQGITLYIGSGCAVDIVQLSKEIKELAGIGIPLQGRLFISSRCNLVQPVHVALDRTHGHPIGTTGNGIGPCYADRALRVQEGSRVSWLIKDMLHDTDHALEIMMMRYSNWIADLGDAADNMLGVEYSQQGLLDGWAVVKEFVVDDPLFLVNQVRTGAKVLFEGAQSVLLDVTHGEQPFVTSSHTTPSYAFVGGDLPCKYHRKTIGVAKAIMSRVGAGPFPTELGGIHSARYCDAAISQGKNQDFERSSFDPIRLLNSGDGFNIGIALRILTGEYGTGSGRPRRIGILDVGQLSQAVALHGIDEIFLNKIDCLTHFSYTPDSVIPILFGDAPNRTIENFLPFSISNEPLPPELLRLLQLVELKTECKIRGIGTGQKRNDFFLFDSLSTHTPSHHDS